MMKRWFHRTVLSRRWLTFIVMGIAFFVFGVGTYNIFMLLSANIDLIAHYGWMAVMDGAARQFLELILTGFQHGREYTKTIPSIPQFPLTLIHSSLTLNLTYLLSILNLLLSHSSPKPSNLPPPSQN
jgi:hypothetical protein